MKNLFIGGIIFISLMNIFSSCNFDLIKFKEVGLCLFTPDELSHFYLNRDSLAEKDIPFFFHDTISFLQDSKDTIFANVSTSIDHWRYTFDSEAKRISGYSDISFSKKSWCEFISVEAIKDFPDDAAEKSIWVKLIENSGLSEPLDNPIDTTVIILGKTYYSIYKIDVPDNSSSKLKEVLFAKKYGVIKIVTTDGRKLERLELSK